MTLLLQGSYICYQRIDLSLGKFFAPCRHLTFSISDRIEDTIRHITISVTVNVTIVRITFASQILLMIDPRLRGPCSL